MGFLTVFGAWEMGFFCWVDEVLRGLAVFGLGRLGFAYREEGGATVVMVGLGGCASGWAGWSGRAPGGAGVLGMRAKF